jgi:glucokinase
MMAELTIGIDIGGTKIACVLVDTTGKIYAQQRLPTNPADGADAVISRIVQGIRAMQDAAIGHTLAGVGIGAPGHVDAVQGMVRNAVNLHWLDVPLKAELKRFITLPIQIGNDVVALMAGETVLGAARGAQNLVYLAVGTGLGGAAITGGRIVSGANHFAVEVGHIALHPGGRRCGCGGLGCTEMYVSGKGILAGLEAHRAQFPTSDLANQTNATTADVLNAAKNGDALAQAIMAEAREALVQAITWSAGILNAELIVIGGGMARAAREYFVTGIEETVKTRLMSPVTSVLRVITPELEDPAIGAACLVWLAARQ